jgi:hypothetical protein
MPVLRCFHTLGTPHISTGRHIWLYLTYVKCICFIYPLAMSYFFLPVEISMGSEHWYMYASACSVPSLVSKWNTVVWLVVSPIWMNSTGMVKRYGMVKSVKKHVWDEERSFSYWGTLLCVQYCTNKMNTNTREPIFFTLIDCCHHCLTS